MIYENQRFTGERAKFAEKKSVFNNCIFDDGESPLKESSEIQLNGTNFQWKYPLWYCSNVVADNCSFLEMARAGIWYTNDILMKNTLVEAPKIFRKCRHVVLEKVQLMNASETLWQCSAVMMNDVVAKGDYFAMSSSNIVANNFSLAGNYGFDSCSNIEINNSKLLSKDAFWNCENVIVRDSYICGEYLGWNSKNLYFENCVIESLQGLCYIDGLVLKNCKLLNTNLCFEYCANIQAEIDGDIVSVKNPISGMIVADKIGEIILESDKINPNQTLITQRK